MTYLDKIKAISKISISGICRELKINRANLMNGNSTEENEKKVYNQLIGELLEIIKKDLK